MISLINVTVENFHRFQDDILEIEEFSFPTPWSVNAFWEEVKKPISHLWVLTMNHELAGYACFWMFSDEIHLMNIAVHPMRRGKGLGNYLLSKIVESGISNGIAKVWLEVRPSNLMARILYQKAGFKEVDRRHRYYTDTKEDAIVMSRSLLRQGREYAGMVQEG
jgi:ribosomal-protein-alanine N-acetyltransferase